mmetsp:Transcript_4119/g.13086  ORF Transcript_4119/g.13086 Transcript_4119/m.13086 type:complete len:392 (+) Transcript_4119:135-1310(+)
MAGASGGPKLVVRNTFLEVFDDSQPLGDTEGSQRRPRAQTDTTDAKLPRKVSYPVAVDEPAYPLGASGTSPASASYGPAHLGGLPEETQPGLLGEGGAPLLPAPGALGAPGGMGMPPFPGFPGYFPPPWGYPGMAPGVPQPFPGFPGMPWGYPGGPLPSDAAPQPQAGRGGGRRNLGEKGGKKGGGAGRWAAGPENQGKGGGGGGGGGGRAAATPGQLQPHAAPQEAVATQVPAERPPTGAETTVMLRNIPNRYTQSMLLTLLEEQNFKAQYDFVYLPMDFRNGVNLGYAFVNLLTHEGALRFKEAFQGFSKWSFDSAKVCEVSWAHPHQGLHEHCERYRNSPVMHPTMPEEYKPMIFKDGERVPFPPPTKAIRAPKLRPVHERTGPAPQE